VFAASKAALQRQSPPWSQERPGAPAARLAGVRQERLSAESRTGIMRTIIISALLGFAVLSPAPTRAVEGETYLVTIPTHDLNLASPAGRDALRGRAKRVADALCGEATRFDEKLAVAACRDTFMNKVEIRAALAAARYRDAL